MNRAPYWLRARMGVRAVSALAAAAAVALILVVAGVALVFLLDNQLRASSQASGEQQVEQLGQRIRANFSGSGDAKTNALEATGKRSDVVQVVTDYGDGSSDPDDEVGSHGPQSDVQVIGSSDTLDSRPRMVDWLLAPGETRVQSSAIVELAPPDGSTVGTTQEMLIVGKGFRATGRPITVLAAQPLQSVHQAVDTVTMMVSIGIPILVLVAGFFTYLFAGRALRPVEAMRRRVAGLTDRDLGRRVPEPVAQDEVGRLARTMNQMLSRLEDSQATQRRFVADASHELRSPLATVSTGLELLGSGLSKDSPDQATVQTLRGETTRLTNLVEGLLFLARADERGLAPRREEVDLDEIVDAERSRPSADGRVAVTVTTEPVRVVGDRGQLVRVVRNLADNARRHAAGTVAVSVRADGDTAVIEVDDDGPGVPEADRTRVFERFVRLDEARARGDGGSGLGLAIVAELVSAHGGTVSAGTADDLGGARFRVTVPLAGSPGALTTGPADAEQQDDRDGDGEPDASGPPEGSTAEAGSAQLFADARPPARPDDPAATVHPADGRVPPQTPSLFDDRPPVGVTGRVPMPDRRRPARDTTTTAQGAGHDEGATPTGALNGGQADGAPNGRQTDGARTPRTAHPAPRQPVTGPLPIRPDTVGSPADENGTRPLPVVRTDPTRRSGNGRPAQAGRAAGVPVRVQDGRRGGGVNSGVNGNGGQRPGS